MKFMVNWQLYPDTKVDVLTVWCSLTAKQRADLGKGIKLIGRWHNYPAGTGVLVVDTNDLSALTRYLGQWTPFMDLEVVPVLSDGESAAAGRKILAEMAG